MPRLQRRYSFGTNETPSSLVLSKELEQKIANGDSAMAGISPAKIQEINNSLKILISGYAKDEPTKVQELPVSVTNHVISHYGLTRNELNERRYKDYLEGFSISNNAQYIPLDIECLSNLSEGMNESILGLFVCLVLDYISNSISINELELIKWGTTFLQRLGKILGMNELVTDSMIKPVSQRAELKQIGVNVDDKDFHVESINHELEKMQPILNQFYKEIIGTFDNLPEKAKSSDELSANSFDNDFLGHTNEEDFDLEEPDNVFDKFYKEGPQTPKKAHGSVHKDSNGPMEGLFPIEHKPKTKNLSSRLFGGISKQICKVLSISPEPKKMHSQPSVAHELWRDDYLIESPPSAAAVLVRNLITRYIMSGFNDARVQVVFELFSEILGVTKSTLKSLENQIASDLIGALEINTARSSTKRMSRKLKIFSATLGGGALIALTAGMATPAVAAGLGILGLGGGGLSSYISTNEGTTMVKSMFGIGDSGLREWKCSKKSDVVRDFQFTMLHEQVFKSLGVAICVGLHVSILPNSDVSEAPDTPTSVAPTSESKYVESWEYAFPIPSCDMYLLKWERKLLISIHRMIVKFGTSEFAENAKQLWLRASSSQRIGDADGTDSGINWPLLMIQYATNLDNAWLVSRQRAEVAGSLLANAICDRQAVGDRHISLIGYSMGARVILYALLKLYDKGKLSSIKDVVLMGLPSTAGPAEWDKCRCVVAGRLLNVYSANDWVLGFLYRYVNMNIAGLQAVPCPGVENWDVSSLVSLHTDYLGKIHTIFSYIGVNI
ncbi:hypothetical protein BEWA_013120 [Theileria equi strain WA]|uniref:DUF726-domain-containing protein n=1 Tax=Theileria equi strain WA TaxID=1537102 RepID=L1LC86_THEEQ|nr:hypothetical protein BEWA_013120 [Theileria equi strain WA]EKX72753.1 hypothetical protein BEWA_013120 [Theileria equi strain WA]|eukprot:XP_004832205.1 hypothetical protein BEWA_013120 [Theileria equi strain WA]